jgi:hypothetical protein
MVWPIGFALLSQEGAELLVDFYLNHELGVLPLTNELHCDTNPKTRHPLLLSPLSPPD